MSMDDVLGKLQLQPAQQGLFSVAEFDVSAKLTGLREFEGNEYKAPEEAPEPAFQWAAFNNRHERKKLEATLISSPEPQTSSAKPQTAAEAKEASFEHEDSCHLCKDDEELELLCCTWCPRVYHANCLTYEFTSFCKPKNLLLISRGID